MGKWGSEDKRQVMVYDPHSSQRALVFREREAREELQRARRSARQQWLRSCVCIMASLFVLLLVLVCLGAIVWVTLKPKPPKLSLQGITLQDIKVLEANGTTLSGNKSSSAGNHTVLYLNSTLYITASNPNRVSARYSTIHVDITYNDVALDAVSTSPFHLQAHANVSVAIPFSVNNMNFFQEEGQNLLKDAQSNHLPIRMTGKTTAKMYTVGIKSQVKLKMDCDIVIQYQDLKVQTNACQSTSSKL